MLQTEYLLNHIDALLRLSHDVKDREVSAELRAMADEFRIMVSVADIAGFAAALSKGAAPAADAAAAAEAAPASDPAAAAALPSGKPGSASEDVIDQPSWFSKARHAGADRAFACTRVGAP
jgi:hypothetical protein